MTGMTATTHTMTALSHTRCGLPTHHRHGVPLCSSPRLTVQHATRSIDTRFCRYSMHYPNVLAEGRLTTLLHAPPPETDSARHSAVVPSVPHFACHRWGHRVYHLATIQMGNIRTRVHDLTSNSPGPEALCGTNLATMTSCPTVRARTICLAVVSMAHRLGGELEGIVNFSII